MATLLKAASDATFTQVFAK